MVAMAPTPDDHGYWMAAADGGVFTYGDAGFLGSAGGIDLFAPIVGMAAVAKGGGYWLVALDGGIFTFGDARFYGSMGAVRLNQPIVAMAATPDGKGYWEVAADGGIFTFGDARFYGSMGAVALNAPIVAMAVTADGKGYWEVAADGGIFTFGDAVFYGSTGAKALNASIAGMAATPKGSGYWLAGSDGAIYTFGDAINKGSDVTTVPTPPIVAFAATTDGGGYWMLDPEAFPTVFSHPAAPSPIPAASTIVAAAAGQVGGNPAFAQGAFCNPYGPCEPWCALFATWVWQQAGSPVPRFGFTGDMYTWAAQHSAVAPSWSFPVRGEAVLYGTGPSSAATSLHVGIVAQVWPDGAIVTVDGDAGPGPAGLYNVIMNGPFLPSQSAVYNGFPIYSYALP